MRTRLGQAILNETPLQIVGTINAYSALQAKECGFKAIYLSGAGVANSCFGLPDLGITTADNVIEEASRLTAACDLPLLVDIDTGFGSFFNIQRTILGLIRAGAAAVHLEDQVAAKRCGHRPNKALVSIPEMTDRLKAAVDANHDPTFTIMARTDALAEEGLAQTLERAHHYIEAGASMIFLEGATSIDDYKKATSQLSVPVLANMTEFGVTPLLHKEELAKAGVKMILYPLSAFRAMNQAALSVYQTIRNDGTQQAMLSHMQTRENLYQTIHYYDYERKLDEILKEGKTA